MIRHIPNSITLVNLSCGVLGICAVFLGHLHLLPWLLGLALLADFLDGLLARALNAGSELGVQLDSLADLVTFGVLPGMLLFYMGTHEFAQTTTLTEPGFAYFALLYPVFAAYRLGKFNIDTRQKEDFLGLPTPAAAMLVLGLWQWYMTDDGAISEFLHCPSNIAAVSLLICALMVSEIPMLSLKISGMQWKGNAWRWVLAGGFLVALILFRENSLPPRSYFTLPCRG